MTEDMDDIDIQLPPVSRRRTVIHDMRQALFSIHMAAKLLERTRHDEQRFNELCRSIDLERRRAGELLEELIAEPNASEPPQSL